MAPLIWEKALEMGDIECGGWGLVDSTRESRERALSFARLPGPRPSESGRPRERERRGSTNYITTHMVSRLPHRYSRGEPIIASSAVPPTSGRLSSGARATLFGDGTLHAWRVGLPAGETSAVSLEEVVQSRCAFEDDGALQVEHAHLWEVPGAPLIVLGQSAASLRTSCLSWLTVGREGGSAALQHVTTLAAHLGAVCAILSTPGVLVVACSSTLLGFTPGSFHISWRLECAPHPWGDAASGLALHAGGLLAFVPSASLVAQLEGEQLKRRCIVELAPPPPALAPLPASPGVTVKQALAGLEEIRSRAMAGLSRSLAPFSSVVLGPSKPQHGGHCLVVPWRKLPGIGEGLDASLPPGLCWRVFPARSGVGCLALAEPAGNTKIWRLVAADIAGQSVLVFLLQLGSSEDHAPVLGRAVLWRWSSHGRLSQSVPTMQGAQVCLAVACERGLTAARITGAALVQSTLFILTQRGTLHIWDLSASLLGASAPSGTGSQPTLQPCLRLRACFPPVLLGGGRLPYPAGRAGRHASMQRNESEEWDCIEMRDGIENEPEPVWSEWGMLGRAADALVCLERMSSGPPLC